MMLIYSQDMDDKYQLGIEVAGIGLGTVDYLADTITLDGRAAELFELPADTPVARDRLHARIHPDDMPAINAKLDRLLDPDDVPVVDVSHRIVQGNGGIVWVNARKQVAFSQSGGSDPRIPVSGLVAIMDVTAHKRDQQRAEFLLQELNHRSKNLLTVIQSIARRTFSGGDIDSFLERFGQRLSGLSVNLDALVNGNWQQVDLGLLVRSHLEAFAAQGTSRITIEGPQVRLSPDQAQAIGLAVHELATNALKYGALSQETGRVRVSWDVDAQDHVVLLWSETGGPEVMAPTRAGFGQTVIQQMAEQSLQGKVVLEYRPEGVSWQARFPLRQVA